jgi:hypothetical protein
MGATAARLQWAASLMAKIFYCRFSARTDMKFFVDGSPVGPTGVRACPKLIADFLVVKLNYETFGEY